MTYGDSGHPSAGGVGPVCKFMFPDTSDLCNWGTNGIQPSGFITGADGSGLSWTEANAGNPPGNRQGLACSGPVTLEPGLFNCLDIAFIYGIDYTQSNNLYGWRTVLNQRIDAIRNYFNNDYTPCGGGFFSDVYKPQKKSPEFSLIIYPNPATTAIMIHFNGFTTGAIWFIFDQFSRTIKQGKLPFLIEIDDMQAGIYFYQLNQENKRISTKLIKL